MQARHVHPLLNGHELSQTCTSLLGRNARTPDAYRTWVTQILELNRDYQSRPAQVDEILPEANTVSPLNVDVRKAVLLCRVGYTRARGSASNHELKWVLVLSAYFIPQVSHSLYIPYHRSTASLQIPGIADGIEFGEVKFIVDETSSTLRIESGQLVMNGPGTVELEAKGLQSNSVGLFYADKESGKLMPGLDTDAEVTIELQLSDSAKPILIPLRLKPINASRIDTLGAWSMPSDNSPPA